MTTMIIDDRTGATEFDHALFRRRLQRFWRLSGWRPVGGWRPGEQSLGQIDDGDDHDLPPMLAFVPHDRSKRR